MRRNLGTLFKGRGRLAGAFCIGSLMAGLSPARATPALTMDLVTGDVLYQQDATQPWFPASTTKLMTVYVALSAVRDHKIAMDTPLVYSAYARTMPPSKMGFRPGTQITLENALRVLMVRSANDVAVTVAEGLAGSVEAFADDMNQAGADLGLHESHFVNPNGLPSPYHVSSARDMAIIARALYTQFPQYASLFDIGALSLGPEIITNHNNLLGRYPGADGMKTGFTCAAGFNVVASAFRDGRRVVAIVMGAPSVATRTMKVAAMFDRAFANVDRPTGSIATLPTSGGAAPDMRNAVCRARGNLIAQFNAEVEQLDAPLMSQSGGLGLSALNPERSFLFNTNDVAAGAPMATRIGSLPQPQFQPIPIHIGADIGYQGVVAQARAPHTPIGSEPAPATVEAYAAAPEPVEGVGIAPLAVDPNALPMHGRRARLGRGAHSNKAAAGKANTPDLKAAKEAPKTKVLANAESEEAASSNKSAAKSAKKHVVAEAKKPAAAHPAKPAAAAKAAPKAPSKKTSAASTE